MRRAVNLTDVGHLTDDASDGDDKIERAARAGGRGALEIAERYVALFRADLAKLNLAEPTLFSKATEHIDDQIALVEKRGFMHAAWLLLDGEKIAKRTGGAPSLDDLVAAGMEPAAFRYYLLTAHYRAPLSFDLDAASAQRTAWQRLARFVHATPHADVAHPRGARRRCRRKGAGARPARLRARRRDPP